MGEKEHNEMIQPYLEMMSEELVISMWMEWKVLGGEDHMEDGRTKLRSIYTKGVLVG